MIEREDGSAASARPQPVAKVQSTCPRANGTRARSTITDGGGPPAPRDAPPAREGPQQPLCQRQPALGAGARDGGGARAAGGARRLLVALGLDADAGVAAVRADALEQRGPAQLQ